MIISQELARVAQALLKDSTASLVEGTWQTLTHLNLTPGQMVQGEVMANLPNSRYLVRVANELLKMEIPLNLQPGQAVELTYVSDDPRPVFALSRGANSGVPVQISDTGRWLNQLSSEESAPSSTSPLPRPSLILSGPPRDPAALAEGLRTTLTRSGVFYEAHLARWVRGEHPLPELLREPQGSLSPLAGRLPAEVTTPPPPASPHTPTPQPAAEQAARPVATASPQTAPAQISQHDPATRAAPVLQRNEPPSAGTTPPAAPQTAPAEPRQGQHPIVQPAGDRTRQGVPASERPVTPPEQPMTSPPRTAVPAEQPPPPAAQQAAAAPDGGQPRAPIGTGPLSPPPIEGNVPATAPHSSAATTTPVPPPQAKAHHGTLSPLPEWAAREPQPAAPPPAATAGGRPPPGGAPDAREAGAGQQRQVHEGVQAMQPGRPATASAIPDGTPAASRTPSAVGEAIPADRPTAAGAVAPQAPQRGLEPQTIPLIREQLATLTTGAFAWTGQVWPGQEMEWTVEEREADGGGRGERSWLTEVAVELPHLGAIRAVLRVAGEGVAVHLVADDDRTATALATGRERLEDGFGAAGIALSGFTVNHARE